MKTATFHSTIQLDRNDRTVEGLRIPPSLDSTLAVNFVLTQEPGKLKPKDLKVAIEKNRAEREQRAEEQRKLREESGGAGGLDLRGILAEEKLNVNSKANAFNRQLREIAFLADVEEVEKQELEKEFRISEDYIGNDLLSEQDIIIVQQQRQLLALYQKKQRWNNVLSRNHTIAHVGHKLTGVASNAAQSSNQQEDKKTNTSSSSQPVVPLKAGTHIDIIHELVVTLKPQFDPNRNDIWSKRMNTLRRFIILTSKWITRKRVEKRLLKLLFYFHENQAFTREEVKQFIITENINARNMANTQVKDQNKEKEKERDRLLLTQGTNSESNAVTAVPTINTSATNANDSIKTLNQFSFTEIFFTQMPSTKLKYQENQEIFLKNRLLIKSPNESEITPEMMKRNLFPQFNIDILNNKSSSSSSHSTVVKPLSDYLNKPIFNDYSFYHLKQKPHYLQMNYQPYELPKIPVYYPIHLNNIPRSYGYEENYQRKGANLGMSLAQYEQVANATTVANGGVVDPILQISEKCYQLYEADILAKEKPKRVVIPASQYQTLVHDPYKGNLEMHLRTKDATVIDALIGDDVLPPWLVTTRPLPSSVENQGGGKKVLDKTSNSPNKKNSIKNKNNKTMIKIPTNLIIKWNRHELDFFTHYPQFRSFLPLLTFHERSATWALRPRSSLPQNNPLLYQLDNSLRTKWIHQHGSGFLSCNYYLLGQMESCWRDDFIPPPGPTLNTYYMIDTDHHTSGLGCFKNDHLRDTNEWDVDIELLQKKLHTNDILTDSESDNEDEIEEAYKPSMKKVKKMLKPQPKKVELVKSTSSAPVGKDKGKGGKDVKAPTPMAAGPPPTTEEAEDEAELDSLTKKEEQVELLRDRKLLDLETTYKKSKQFLFQNMSQKLMEISQEMSCITSTLPIQLSFHEYDHQVYQLMNSMLPELNNSLVEYDPNRQSWSQLPTNTTLTLTNNFSPVKTFNKYHPFLGNKEESATNTAASIEQSKVMNEKKESPRAKK